MLILFSTLLHIKLHHSNLPPTTEEVNVIVRDVCLSVCLLARLLKNARMDLADILRVTDAETWTNLSTFEPDPDHSPDAGIGLLSPISYALQRGILLRLENPTYRYWAPIAVATCGFEASKHRCREMRSTKCASGFQINYLLKLIVPNLFDDFSSLHNDACTSVADNSCHFHAVPSSTVTTSCLDYALLQCTYNDNVQYNVHLKAAENIIGSDKMLQITS